MNHTFVAGTFDRLHSGHRSLLQAALKTTQEITIGITSDKFVQKYKADRAHVIQPFTVRKKQIELWVAAQPTESLINLLEIHDQFEPASSSAVYTHLVVTKENKNTGANINAKRIKRQLLPLILVEVPIVPASDHLPISSTRIRNGIIDTQGKLILPHSLRRAFKDPFGRILSRDAIQASMLHHQKQGFICVGDKTTKTAREFGILPRLSVIDLQVERKPFGTLDQFQFPQDVVIHSLKSGPGYISQDVIAFCKAYFASYENNESSVLLINGEDDLVTLAILVNAPIDTIVYYGQPKKGIVEVIVNQDIKQRCLHLLNQFELEKH